MTPADAKAILLAYRPGSSDNDDPEVAEALRLARHDPKLRQWLQQQTACQQVIRNTFREAPVPDALREKIISRRQSVRTIIRPLPWWRQPSWIAAAAALVLLLGIASLRLRPPPEGSFPIFRSRMVSAVLRQYSMDIVTNDLQEIRRFHRQKGAPSDYLLPPGLARLPLSGAGALRWQDSFASMVCLNSPSHGILFLFVVDESHLEKPPPPTPRFQQVNKLMTASWSVDGKAYLLAGSGDESALRNDAGF